MPRTMKMGLIGSSRNIISMMSGIEIIKNRMKEQSLMNKNIKDRHTLNQMISCGLSRR
jgi:hypothetical protein